MVANQCMKGGLEVRAFAANYDKENKQELLVINTLYQPRIVLRPCSDVLTTSIKMSMLYLKLRMS